MRRALSTRNPRQALGQLLLAVLLGASAGLFVSGYWLIDLFPADSRLLAGFSAVAGVIVGLGYWRVLPTIRRSLTARSARELLWLGSAGAIIAVFLFFAGTSQWQHGGRYIGFLLPRQHFRLTSAGAQEGTSIVWINTSFGDVSYEALSYSGWVRRGEHLVLTDAESNSLEWGGRAAERVEIVFASPNSGSEFQIEWGDGVERIRLNAGKTSYERALAIPYLASTSFVIALGLLHFWFLSNAAILLGSGHRTRVNSRGDSPGSGGRKDWNRRELPVLAAIMVLALLLRVFHLGAMFPAVDEYYHLIAADQLLSGAPIDSVYPRGLWIVTIPVSWALQMLGHEVWAARAIGVVFNVLALVPLYLIARRVSVAAAVATGLMFATSPWIITFARVAREYAYYPLYFYLIVLGMVALVEAVPAGFVLVRHWRVLLRPRIVLLGMLLLLPPVFALKIDWLSTFRTILIAYLVLGAFLLARLDWRARSNWPALGIGALVIGWSGWYFYNEQLTKLLVIPRVNPVPLNYFFPNPPQQWYYDRVEFVVALAVVIATVVAIAGRRSAVVPLFLVGLFGAYLGVFTLFSKSFFHTRHLISTQFWFVAVVGLGLGWLWQRLRSAIAWKGVVGATGLALGLAVLVVNPSQVLLPTVSRNPDMPISEDYLHDMSAVQAYLQGNVGAGDALISTVYGLYATWEGKPEFSIQYRINTGTSLSEITSIVNEHEAGWIVIDSIRLDMSGLSARSITSIPQIEYIGSFGDEHVWRWGRPLAGSPASDF